MRHHNANKKFGREEGQRKALMRSLAVSLIRDEAILTTEAKAKALRPYVEEMITKARKDSPATRRLLAERLGGAPASVKKLVDTLGPRYEKENRPGGYTRVIKTARRLSDGSTMARISLV